MTLKNEVDSILLAEEGKKILEKHEFSQVFTSQWYTVMESQQQKRS